MSMVTMVKQGHFFNPCRASSCDIIVRSGNRVRRQAFIDKQPAVAIITGYCTDSNLIHGRNHTKSIGVIFHGQEWERYCCFMTMIFNEKRMVAQLYQSALSFSTLPESISVLPRFPNASLSPLSGRAAQRKDTAVERAQGTLYFADISKVSLLSIKHLYGTNIYIKCQFMMHKRSILI
jgi:hypothetical protein